MNLLKIHNQDYGERPEFKYCLSAGIPETLGKFLKFPCFSLKSLLDESSEEVYAKVYKLLTMIAW